MNQQQIAEIDKRIERVEAQIHYVIDRLDKMEKRMREAEKNIELLK